MIAGQSSDEGWGLGMRQVRSLALPANLASVASTSDLQSQIRSVTSCATDMNFDTYLTTWQTTFGSLIESEPHIRKQSFWDRPGILASRAVVESTISDSVGLQMTTFLAASAPHSGGWLLAVALPVSSCVTRTAMTLSK